MLKVNSISGGKTSAYLYAHYLVDYNIFSLVCIEDSKCAHPDKKIMQLANDKLQKYCSHQKEFIGTCEHYSIVKTVLDLEQKYGKEIIWLRGESLDAVIRKRKAIPNQFKRFCTTETKIKPIFEFCNYRIGEIVKMAVGFRIDEQERKDRFQTTYKNSHMCEIREKKSIHRWQNTDWRVGWFPLIDEFIGHSQIVEWSKKTGIYFHSDSNCQMCFWKPVQQLRKNFDHSYYVMQWAKRMENEIGYNFKKIPMKSIENIGLQLDFNFGTGSGCQAGFCTD